MSVYFDESPISSSETMVVGPVSPLRMLLLEAAKALGSLRDKASITEKLFILIFSITPADCAAVLIDGSLWGRDREGSDEAVPVSRAILDRVLKQGGAVLSNDG